LWSIASCSGSKRFESLLRNELLCFMDGGSARKPALPLIVVDRELLRIQTL
jgi:hypothetical protein